MAESIFKPYPYPSNPTRVRFTRSFYRFLGRIIFRAALKITISGMENIPAIGPVMLLFNHVTAVDPPVVALFTERRVPIVLSKIELTYNVFSNFIVWGWGNISIRRGEVDRAAIRQAFDVLKSENILMIAPEGHRNIDGLRNPMEGTAMFASQGHAIMVPAGVSGTQHVFSNLKRLRRTPITYNVGQPFRLKPGLTRRHYPQIVHEIMYRIAPLVEPDLRGEYADFSKATMETIELL